MKVIDVIYKLSRFCLFLSMGVMSVTIIMQVFTRTFFDYSFAWVEELARILLVWSTFLGASVAYREKALASFDMLERKLSGKLSIVHKILIQILIIMFLTVVIVYGFKLMFQPIVYYQTSPSLNIPMYALYASVPIGALLIMIYTLNYMKELILQSIESNETSKTDGHE
jgi:TRAP-type C4-dicarboxylate transport system permease small subunit